MKQLQRIYKTCAILCTFILCFSACEKPVMLNKPKGGNQQEEGMCRLTFNMSYYQQIPFEKATKLQSLTNTKLQCFDNVGIPQHKSLTRAKKITEVCTRISLALFRNGEKEKSVSQEKGDKNFGNISISLAPGTYQLVAIAHSGVGSATIKSPEEITFAKNKLSDTFYFYQVIKVGEDKTYNLEMKRAVAMFRLVTLDAIPDTVKTMQFKYTGGSSTFNAVTGYGCKKSRQKEECLVTSENRKANATFEVYTFPHAEEGVLKITVSALNASKATIIERPLQNVHVKINEITQCEGAFFQNSARGDSYQFSFYVYDEWKKTNRYKY